MRVVTNRPLYERSQELKYPAKEGCHITPPGIRQPWLNQKIEFALNWGIFPPSGGDDKASLLISRDGLVDFPVALPLGRKPRPPRLVKRPSRGPKNAGGKEKGPPGSVDNPRVAKPLCAGIVGSKKKKI